MAGARHTGAKFAKDVSDYVTGAKGFIQAVHKNALEEVGWRLIKYSPTGYPPLWKDPHWPKGYTPGHLRNNWQVGIDVKPTGEIPGSDPEGYRAQARYRFGRWTINHKFYFVNTAPYSYLIETGTHSYQCPPGGMVGRVKSEWRQIVQQAIADTRSTNSKWRNEGVE